MKLDELLEVKFEIKRLSDTIDEAIALAKSTSGHTIGGGTYIYGKHDISGTRMAGAVRRRAQDLKYYLTKKL
jgi:hypothetical protein